MRGLPTAGWTDGWPDASGRQPLYRALGDLHHGRGIDRPLRSESDFQRFSGQVIDLTLRQPLGSAAGGVVSAQRKKFRGLLEPALTTGQWQISWRDEPATKPGARVSKKKEQPPLQVLGFRLDELKEARLAPIVDFKGRRLAVDNLE